MEASGASSCFEDQEFCFEVPITNINIKKSPADVLYENNNGNTEASKPLTNSESIVIDETDDIIDDQKDAAAKDSTKHYISIAIDDEENDEMVNEIEIEIAALDEGINNEIINNNHKGIKEIGTIDLDTETDNVTVCNRTDSDVIILDGNKTDSDTTIILNDDEINNFTKQNNKHTDVIDVEKDTDCSIVESSGNIDGAKYGVLTELIQKCLSMKNCVGMPRVINRTLLVLYKDVDEAYKKSDEFKKFISDTIMLLSVEPDKKFSHIKNLCNNMKQHKTKKRVPFITLDEDKEQSTSIPNKKRKVVDIIDLDDDTNNTQSKGNCVNPKNTYPIGKVYPSINLNSSDDEVAQEDKAILLNKENRETKKNTTFKNTATVKNNSTVQNTRKNKKFKKTKDKEKKRALKQAKNNKSLSIAQNNLPDPDMLLEPRMSVGVEITESNQAKINTIEKRISVLKYQLEILEEAEVLTDTTTSPYITCERIKTTILMLYRQLCQLTGTEVTKRHEVRLQVVPGHPEGPVRCLEDFLNENIDEHGNPPFPDMADVLDCVLRANRQYNLFWSSSQVLNEAQALFTQFGQSMQKRRQQREWKDLMSLVKQEVPDPADEDPALLARLEDNKKIAKRNELDLLDRYAKMEHGIYPTSDPGLRLRVNESEESEDTDIPDYDDNTYLQISRTDMAPSVVDVNNLATTNEDMVDRLRITNVASNGLISTTNEHIVDRLRITNVASNGVISTTNEDMVDRLRITNVASNGVISTTNEDMVDRLRITNVASNGVISTTNEDMVDRLRITNVASNGVISTTTNEDIVDRLRITNVASNSVISTTNTTVGNIQHGSTVSVCGGNIVIQPMIQPSENTTCKLQASSINIPFVSEYNRFLNNRTKSVLSKKILPRNRVDRTISETFTENSAIERVECNETDLEIVTKIAKDIITLVQSEQGTYLASDKLIQVNNTLPFNPTASLVQSNQGTDLTIGQFNHVNNVISFNPTVRLTKLNLKDFENKSTTIFVHSALMASNSNAGCVNEILTHTKDVTNKDITQSKELNKNSENIGSNVLEKENEIKDVDVESIVKPEPLDIPSLLQELGENYTATIFDIEDPFLVIEISDSSESEDENDLEDA